MQIYMNSADINKFCLMLREDVYWYEYMDSWKRFDETLLPEKEDSYSNLNMEDITDAEYKHAKRVRKDSKIKKSRWVSWFVRSKW